PLFQEAELPAYPGSFWKLIGPGAVLLGLSIGAGELIVWPTVAGRFGPTMIWAAGVGIALQLVINLEVARYTLATGETAYTGFARLWRGFAPLFIVFTISGWLLPGWARSCGEALRALALGAQTTPAEGGPDWLWTTVTFGVVAAMLFGPRLVYRSVERWTELMVVVAILGLLMLAIWLGTPALWLTLSRGVLNLGYKEPSVGYPDFLSWIVFAGAGGTANLFFSFYLRDKSLGMGARLPPLTNILRDHEPRDSLTGYRFPNSAPNCAEWRRWWRHAVKDQVFFFWFLNSLTILLFIFGALAVLHPLTRDGVVHWEGQRPFLNGKEVGFLALHGLVLGRIHPLLTTVYLLVAVATLLSTQLTLVDGVSRSLADLVHTNFLSARSRPLSFWYALFSGGWMLLGCLLTYLLETSTRAQSFLFVTGFAGGMAMAVYCPLMMWVNRRFLPACARPGRLMTGLMALVSLFYLGYAVYSLMDLLGA
ncbi:MAG: Nramp family divalent metal transporter, partial [Acidobacteria bacterium]|nr:Nramp family divalent metal transporter [Acidobacteriota bacterium]